MKKKPTGSAPHITLNEHLASENRWKSRVIYLALLPDGEPCDHVGCLSHVSHPCEGCGRVGGIRMWKSQPRPDVDYCGACLAPLKDRYTCPECDK